MPDWLIVVLVLGVPMVCFYKYEWPKVRTTLDESARRERRHVEKVLFETRQRFEDEITARKLPLRLLNEGNRIGVAWYVPERDDENLPLVMLTFDFELDRIHVWTAEEEKTVPILALYSVLGEATLLIRMFTPREKIRLA